MCSNSSVYNSIPQSIEEPEIVDCLYDLILEHIIETEISEDSNYESVLVTEKAVIVQPLEGDEVANGPVTESASLNVIPNF